MNFLPLEPLVKCAGNVAGQAAVEFLDNNSCAIPMAASLPLQAHINT